MANSTAQKKVFISHSSADKERIWPIVEKLKENGVSLWVDALEMRPGVQLFRSISDAISESTFVAIIVSSTSVNSRWVKEEVKQALSQEFHEESVKVIPCLLEKCELPSFLRDRIYCDFTGGIYDGICDLLSGLYPDYHIIKCNFDRKKPFYLEEISLRSELNRIFRLNKGIQSFLLTLDYEPFMDELRLAFVDMQEDDSSIISIIPTIFANLSYGLSRVTDVVQEYHGRHIDLANTIIKYVQKSTQFVLYRTWRKMLMVIDPETIRALQSVSGDYAINKVAEIRKKVGKPRWNDAEIEAYAFACPMEDLLYLGLQGKKSNRSATIYVPPSSMTNDTLNYVNSQSYPLSPDTEIFNYPWLEYFLPGLVKDLIVRISEEGHYFSQFANQFSFRKEDYQHFGFQ